MASHRIETYARGLAFPIGALIFSQSVDRLVRAGRLDPIFGRHTRGDWGDVNVQQWQANSTALQSGASLESHYVIPGLAIRIVTDAQRHCHRHRVAVRGLSTVHPQATQARTFNLRPAPILFPLRACHCPLG